jgi:curved DNA-binding protein CbpA
MAGSRPLDDPYRVLGVLRGASLDEIKAAHRRLAKRFHPDRAGGDEQRFLAVQEAYQLLADPGRRREWDRRHAPVPSWAPGSGSDDERAGSGPARPSRGSGVRGRGTARGARQARPPGQRTATWSAAHVPWWHDFRPRKPGEAAESATGSERSTSRSRRASGPAREAADHVSPNRPAATSEPFDLDAHSRSSGAAWSMAARRHFRRGDRDLPSRGAWRYRGTQVVTGAEARKVADEEAGRAPGTGAAGPGTQAAGPGSAHANDGVEDEPG